MAAEYNKSPSMTTTDKSLENVGSGEVDSVVADLPDRAVIMNNNRYARAFSDYGGTSLYKVDATAEPEWTDLVPMQFIPLGGARVRIRGTFYNRFLRTTQSLNYYVHANSDTGLEQDTVFEVEKIGPGNFYAFKHVLTNRYLTRDATTSGVLRDTLRATSVNLNPQAIFRVFPSVNLNDNVASQAEALAQPN